MKCQGCSESEALHEIVRGCSSLRKGSNGTFEDGLTE